MRHTTVLVTMLALGWASIAQSDCSTPPFNSTVPPQIVLVGHDGAGHADPLGYFQLTIRDVTNTPVPGANVIVDFSACSDLRIAAVQPYPGLTVGCAGHTVTAVTDAQGVARFDIVGGAINTGNSPGSVSGCANLYWDTCLLTSGSALRVGAPDEGGLDGVDSSDLALLLGDVFGGYRCRSDLDNSGALGPNDVTLFLKLAFGNGSTSGAGSLAGGVCP